MQIDIHFADTQSSYKLHVFAENEFESQLLSCVDNLCSLTGRSSSHSLAATVVSLFNEHSNKQVAELRIISTQTDRNEFSNITP